MGPEQCSALFPYDLKIIIQRILFSVSSTVLLDSIKIQYFNKYFLLYSQYSTLLTVILHNSCSQVNKN